jgi:hypothetical protein
MARGGEIGDHGAMQRLPCLALLLVAVGCGGKARPASSSGTGASSAVPIPDGPPCPDASSVAIAVVHQPSAGAPGGWHLPLANRASTETTARYQVLDAAAAAAAAIPAPPAKLWLMTGGTLCEATPGPWYSDVVIDGPANEVLGVQLSTKCPVPGSEQPQQALALAAEVAPAGCVAISPRPVAGRVGEEQGGRWSLLPQSTPMPPAVEAALPKKDCAAPCETLWTVAQVDFAGKPIAWDVAMEWLHVDPAQPDACQWASEGDGGVLVASPAGAVPCSPARRHRHRPGRRGHLTKVAAKKTAGVLGDDLALNAQQVAGVRPTASCRWSGRWPRARCSTRPSWCRRRC